MNNPRTMTTRCQPERRSLWWIVVAIIIGAGVGCSSLPDINIATKEPIKVDIQMRLDVYQYSGDEESKPEADVEYADAVKRQRDRMAQVTDLKNNRWVGENHLGLLSVRLLPAGDDGKWVRTTVDDENKDRMILMRNAANSRKVMLHKIQEEQWKQRTEASFAGEWIEIAGEREGTFKWEKKEGELDAGKKGEPEAEKKDEPKPDDA
jgi:hypothetical protein